jgi:hypothetical protein
MNTLFAILAIAAASAETTASAWIWDENERTMQLNPTVFIADEGETWLGTLTSDDDPSVQGKLLWAPETGRLYAQGSSDQGAWVLDAQCTAFGEGQLCASAWGRVTNGSWGRISGAVHSMAMTEEIWNDASGVASGDLLWELIGEATDGDISPTGTESGEALAYWQPSKSAKEVQFVVGGQSFRVEIDGVDAGHFMGVELQACGLSDDESCVVLPLSGIHDRSGGTFSLSYGSTGYVAVAEGSATLGDDGLEARGSIMLWNHHAGEGSVLALGIADRSFYTNNPAGIGGDE